MYILIVLIGIILDQVTKYWAFVVLKGGRSIEVIDKFLYFTYSENSGAAWGMFKNATLFFTIVTIPVVIGIIWYMLKNRNNIDMFVKLPLAMIISGAIGNLIDRIRLGYVIDFIFSPLGGLYDFPIFNLADMYISVATIMLIVYILFFEGKDEITKQ